MDKQIAKPPASADLYFASMVANMLVYLGTILLWSAFIWFASEPAMGTFTTVLTVAVLGLIAAFLVGLVIVAPLGVVFGSAVLGLTRHGWWQGPLTGALVALSLEAMLLAIFSADIVLSDRGNWVLLAVPLMLAIMAGAYVQRRVLKWPATIAR